MYSLENKKHPLARAGAFICFDIISLRRLLLRRIKNP